MDGDYSNVGAVVGATYPEMGRALRKIMPHAYILVPGYGAQGGKGADLVHFFNEDGLNMYRVYSVENQYHTFIITQAQLTWNFFKMFRRDSKTGKIVNFMMSEK